MRPGPGIWFGGVSGSALAHIGFAALLLWSLRPDPVDHQPNPQSELKMQAYRVPHSTAIPQEAQGDPAAQTEARKEGVTAGAIPQSSAKPITSQGSQVEPLQPKTTALNASLAPPPQAEPVAAQMNRLSQSAVQPAKLSAATQPAAQTVAQSMPAVAQASVVAQPNPVVLASAMVEPSLTATLPPRPDAAPLAVVNSIPTPPQQPDTPGLAETEASPAVATLSRPNSTPSPEQQPDATALNEQPPAPIDAALSEPDVPYIKAALAFSGAGAGQADPVSLAAFQSFMMPDDVAAAGDTLRDGVAGILAAVPCSRLQVQFDPETATLNLRGHLPENGLRAPVLAALQAQMGADIQVSDQMKLLPRPQCGALSGISNVGLPQSTDQITNPLLIGDDTHARVLDYAQGDPMFFDLTAPDYDAYVYVDYFDAGGAVLHLSPNDIVPLTLSPAQSRLRVGAKNPGDPGLQIVVGPPYGQEIAVAFAASHPLYTGLRPISEKAAPYLTWLSDRVTEARAIYPDFKGEWVYFFVSTTAQ